MIIIVVFVRLLLVDSFDNKDTFTNVCLYLFYIGSSINLVHVCVISDLLIFIASAKKHNNNKMNCICDDKKKAFTFCCDLKRLMKSENVSTLSYFTIKTGYIYLLLLCRFRMRHFKKATVNFFFLE